MELSYESNRRVVWDEVACWIMVSMSNEGMSVKEISESLLRYVRSLDMEEKRKERIEKSFSDLKIVESYRGDMKRARSEGMLRDWVYNIGNYRCGLNK